MRFAAVAAVVVLATAFVATSARADVPVLPFATPAPAWLLQYSETTFAPPLRVNRSVTTRPDGTLEWQQLTVDTGIVNHGPAQSCYGRVQLSADEVRTMEDAMRAFADPRPMRAFADPRPAVTAADERALVRGGGVAVALIVPRDSGRADVSSIAFDPTGADADPRLKRAAAIWSRYRCPVVRADR